MGMIWTQDSGDKKKELWEIKFQVQSLGSNNFDWFNWAICLMSRVFANGQRGWGSIPGWVIPKAQKMVLDAVLLNTQHYKVGIKGKVEPSREWSGTFPYTLV